MNRLPLALAILAAAAVPVACGGSVTPASQRDVPFERIPAAPGGTAPVYQVMPHPSGGWAITVGMGEQRTGGYSIRIEKLRLTGNALTVTVSTATPPPGAVTIQVITYPSDTVRVKREDLPGGDLKVLFVDSRGARLAEQQIKN